MTKYVIEVLNGRSSKKISFEGDGFEVRAEANRRAFMAGKLSEVLVYRGTIAVSSGAPVYVVRGFEVSESTV
jgi:hypothetical protein